jgi:Uma2 family endonuclease
MDRVSTDIYLDSRETHRRRELVWGMVREPAAPYYGHQRLVTTLTVFLQTHVWLEGLGEICVSPVDVVLDAPKALIVQPDIIYLSNKRRGIVRKQVWGAPDLAIEVISAGTEDYDRRRKVRWFKMYGVRECWLVYPNEQIVVCDLEGRRTKRRAYGYADTIRSTVLPDLKLRVANVFRT